MILPECLEVQYGWAIKQFRRRGTVISRCHTEPNPRIFQIQLLQAGCLEFSSQGQQLQQSAGSVLVLPPLEPGVNHVTHILEDTESITVGFRLLLFGSIDVAREFMRMGVWQPGPVEYAALDGMLRLLLTQSDPPTQPGTFIVDGLARALVGICWEALGMENITGGLHAQVPKWLVLVMQEVRHNPGLTVSDLERIAGYSHAHFHRVFQQYTGISPRAYLQRHRLDIAKHLLTTTEMSVTAISDHLGFATVADFGRFFRRLCFVNPSSFREGTSLVDPELLV